MSTVKDAVQDIVRMTAGLALLNAVKVTGSDSETTLDAMDTERTVIVKASLHNPNYRI